MSIISKDGLKLIQDKDKVFCDSRELAKQFGKDHDMILKKIRKEIGVIEKLKLTSQIDELFVLSDYGKTKKRYARYKLTFEGFQQIALSLTGDDSVRNRYKFIKLFKYLISNIEKDKLTALENSKDKGWLEFREEGKVYRTKLTDAIKIYVADYRIDIEGKINDGRYYQHYTDIINRTIGIDLPKGTNPRDVLNTQMLVKLVLMEDKVADMIEKYSKDGMHYKEVYKKIKEELK